MGNKTRIADHYTKPSGGGTDRTVSPASGNFRSVHARDGHSDITVKRSDTSSKTLNKGYVMKVGSVVLSRSPELTATLLGGNTVTADDYMGLIHRLPLRPIRNGGQLEAAHKMIDELSLQGEENLSPDQLDYLLVLGDQVSRYEDEQEQDEPVSGRDLLNHLAESNDLSGSDIGRIVGQRELGPKLLKGDRQISKTHARLLGDHFGLPAEVFLRE